MKEAIGSAILITIFLGVAVAAMIFLGRGVMNPSPHTVCQAEYGTQSKWDYDLKRCIDGVEPKMSRGKP